MANKIQAKRTSVSGRTPNTTNSSNGSYIDAGEFAVNLADQKLFTSNGTVAFEVGSNLSSLSVTGTTQLKAISANGSLGGAGQVLTSNGTSTYWSTASGGPGGGTTITPTLVDIDFGNADVVAKTVGVVDGSAVTSMKVFASIPLAQPSGVEVDELELDPLSVHGSVLADGTVTLMIVSTNGSSISGHRYVQYFLV